MRLLKFVLAVFAGANGGQAGRPCTYGAVDGKCLTDKRLVYVHVDHFGRKMEEQAYLAYLEELAAQGADYLLVGEVAADDADMTGTAAHLQILYQKLQEARAPKPFVPPGSQVVVKVKTPYYLFLRRMINTNAKLILTIGGGCRGCARLPPDARATAERWCSYAATHNYQGVNFNLDAITTMAPDGPEVEWYKTAAGVCRQHVKEVFFTAQAEKISRTAKSPIDTLLAWSWDRFIIQLRTTGRQLSASDTDIFQHDLDLVKIIEQRTPQAKGRLVIGKYMFNSACTSWTSESALVAFLEQAENAGYNGGISMFKAPAPNTNDFKAFVTKHLPQVSIRRSLSSRPAGARLLLATADGTTPIANNCSSSDIPQRRNTTFVSAAIPHEAVAVGDDVSSDSASHLN